MAIVTRKGGAHYFYAPNVWAPNTPQDGDIALISAGDAIAIDRTLDGAAIALQGTDPPQAAGLDLFQATLGANETVSTSVYTPNLPTTLSKCDRDDQRRRL